MSLSDDQQPKSSRCKSKLAKAWSYTHIIQAHSNAHIAMYPKGIKFICANHTRM